MAAFRRGILFTPPLMQCRHRGKLIVGRPQPGPVERRVFEAITQPIVLDDLEDPNKHCARFNRLDEMSLEKEISQYERVYLRDVERVFEKHALIASCQPMSMNMRDLTAAKNLLLDSGLRVKHMSNPHVKMVIENSKFKHLMPLVRCKNLYIISKEPRVKELVTTLKKIPQLILLGAIVEDRILNREGLVQAAALPSMDLLLGETCSILGSHASRTHSLLTSHQRTLSTHLQQYINDQTEPSNS